MSERKRTARGWVLYDEFPDDYGVPVEVRQAAADAPALWVYLHDDAHGQWHLGEMLHPALHLSPSRAARLIVALSQFVQDASEVSEAAEANDDER